MEAEIRKGERRCGGTSRDLAEPTGNRALIHRKPLLKLPNARTERRPECGGRAAAKRAARMPHVERSLQ
jgi:hypothetical protein